MSDRSGFDQLRDMFRGRPGAGDLGAGQDPAEVSQGHDQQVPVIPHSGTDGAMLPGGDGYISPQIAPGTPYSPELNTAPTTPKDTRWPAVPKLWDYKRITVAAAGIVGVMDQVGFPISAVRIDNWTALYVLVRGPNVYVPPFTVGTIVKTFNNPQSVEIISEAPPSIAQGAITAGQICDVWCFEDDLTPSPGQTITSAGGNHSSTLNTGQIAVGAAATLVLANNASRRSVVITNSGATTVYVGNAGVTVATGEYLPSGASIEFTSYIGAVYAVGAGGTVTYAEESA